MGTRHSGIGVHDGFPALTPSRHHSWGEFVGSEHPVLRCALSPASRVPSARPVRIQPACSGCCFSDVCLDSGRRVGLARLPSRRASTLVAGQEVCIDWCVMGVLALHDEDHTRVVPAEDRRNVVDFLFRRDSPQLHHRICHRTVSLSDGCCVAPYVYRRTAEQSGLVHSLAAGLANMGVVAVDLAEANSRTREGAIGFHRMRLRIVVVIAL